MSLSQAAQQENLYRALKLLMDDAGDSWIRKALINPESDAFKNIHQTTWQDLRSRHLIQDATGGRVVLTGKGWEAGLKLTGRDNRSMRKNLERIYKALEATVAGRSTAGGAAPVRMSDIGKHASLPSVLIANVIETRLIESWLKRRGASWAAGFEGRLILVPPDFGVEIK